MILFAEVENLIKSSFRIGDPNFKDIILNQNTFSWIKEQNFEKIFLVTNQKGIEEGWLNERLFDLGLEYIKVSLELFTKVSVECRYYPYKGKNGSLIKDIMEEFKIDAQNAIVLGDKKDAIVSGVKYYGHFYTRVQ